MFLFGDLEREEGLSSADRSMAAVDESAACKERTKVRDDAAVAVSSSPIKRRKVDENFVAPVPEGSAVLTGDSEKTAPCPSPRSSPVDLKVVAELQQKDECVTEIQTVDIREAQAQAKPASAKLPSPENMESPLSAKTMAVAMKRPSPTEIPSAAELQEFFAAAEKLEQKRFKEKYNYDIAKDVPLEGRYQWIRLKQP